MVKCNHKASGYMRDVPYVRFGYVATDATGVMHVDLMARCDYCGKEFIYAKTHLNPQVEKLRERSPIYAELLAPTK